MSFDKKKRETIKNYILDKISAGAKDYVKKTVNAFGITSTTVYRYLADMEKKDILIKSGTKYDLKTTIKTLHLKRSNGELKDESLIYNNFLQPDFSKKKDNVRRIWEYSFSEMMNNAIDHSEAEDVTILYGQNHICAFVIIYDNGIGIFKKIKEFLNLNSYEDAAKELFKGKLTTDSENHSGEGIFFTSRMMDEFAAISEGIIFSHIKYNEVIKDLESIKTFKEWKAMKGTIIYMSLSERSGKKTKEIFDKYANVDDGFIKTSIKIKNIFDDFPVSRSQAKRLVNGLEKFEVIELDFTGIDEIGQGFADELFRVFANKNPGVQIIPVKMSKDVKSMYNHVTKAMSKNAII